MPNNKSVIAIDDDPDDLGIMEGLINEIDKSVQFNGFLDAEGALERLRADGFIRPDFLFVDMNMPRVGGPEVLKHVRSIQTFKESTIIMYSTSMPENVSRELVSCGATLTMRKPNNVSDYLAILEYIIGGKPNPEIDVRDGLLRLRGAVSY